LARELAKKIYGLPMSLQLRAKKFCRTFYWYPPAETKIPWSAILSAFTRKTADFKDTLCSYLNVDQCTLGESARALLFKLLQALKKQDGGRRDEVLIPGYTCYSVAAAVAKAGLKITVYDLDPKTLYADLNSIEKAISKKTLAVVTQHLFGMLTPIDEVKKITHQYGAYLIEDAAQAFGKVGDLNAPGTMGDFGLFSFGRGKPLPIGGGGALVSCSHPEFLNLIKFDVREKGYRQAAMTATAQIISKPAFYWIPEMLPFGLGETVFDPDFLSMDIPKALEKIAVYALSTLGQLNSHRKRLSNVYAENIPEKYLVGKTEEANSIIRFPVMLPNTSLTKEMKRLGIRRMYPKAISDEHSIKPYLKDYQKRTLGATEVAVNMFTLPTHMGNDERMAKDISTLVQKSVRQD
jgi:perosamine synthetase